MSKYSEDTAVEQPAIDLFDELGWERINACEKVMASGGPGRISGRVRT